MLLADTEATDEFFCEKYFQSDEDSFLAKCSESVAATKEMLSAVEETYKIGKFVSSSFFKLFSRSKFTDLESDYTQTLEQRYQQGKLARVETDIAARLALYRRLYGNDKANDKQFLINRTLRTMAQYLVLGRLMGQDTTSCTIVHDTVNASLFQSINKYCLPNDERTCLEVTPVIKSSVRVDKK